MIENNFFARSIRAISNYYFLLQTSKKRLPNEKSLIQFPRLHGVASRNRVSVRSLIFLLFLYHGNKEGVASFPSPPSDVNDSRGTWRRRRRRLLFRLFCRCLPGCYFGPTLIFPPLKDLVYLRAALVWFRVFKRRTHALRGAVNSDFFRYPIFVWLQWLYFHEY